MTTNDVKNQFIMDEFMILDLYWDRMQVKKKDGTIAWRIRGKDYDLDWLQMGDSFAKFEGLIFLFDRPIFQKLKKSIDFETFDLIASNGNNAHYFKDKNQVYLKYYNAEYILTDASPDLFNIMDINEGLSTDDLNYYVFEKQTACNLSKALVLNTFYSIYNDQIFFCYQEKIENADVESFQVIRENLAKDKNHVYFRTQIVEGADANSFQIVPECIDSKYYEGIFNTFYAKDKSRAYFVDSTCKTIKSIKSKSINAFRFEVINEIGFGSDLENNYHRGKKIKK